VHGISSMTSITIVGSDNRVADNAIVHSDSGTSAGDGISVTGDANVVADNRVATTAVDGIVVAGGTGNTITGNVLDATNGCGVFVAADAAGTLVTVCTVTHCDLGLVNSGTDTSLTDSKLTFNRFADVLDLAGFRAFDANAFGTLSHDAFLAPKH
jgi:hypothetical protein